MGDKLAKLDGQLNAEDVILAVKDMIEESAQSTVRQDEFMDVRAEVG